MINEVEQLAAFEYASCQTSGGVRRLLAGLRPGMTEREAVRLLDWDGSPLSCHLMLTAGPRATLGLLSPGDRPIERGDRFTTAFGIWGALTCRAGFVVEDAAELPAPIADYVERLVGPYFEAVAEWYGALHVGQTGGALQAIIDRQLGDPFFGISLNPGHQLHLDEWVNSPIGPGSNVELRSGMALQVDVIPATGTDYFTTNIEDGVALADEPLRAAFAAGYPAAWARIQARRRFMAEALGIDLHPDVLPFSNIPAYLPPFLLRPDRAMTSRRHPDAGRTPASIPGSTAGRGRVQGRVRHPQISSARRSRSGDRILRPIMLAPCRMAWTPPVDGHRRAAGGPCLAGHGADGDAREFDAPERFVVAAQPARIDAVAVEPQTHAPARDSSAAAGESPAVSYCSIRATCSA